MRPIFFALPGNENITTHLGRELECEVGQMVLRRFPDGETYVRLQNDVSGKSVILVCTLNSPDEKFLPLYFLCQTSRDLGAANIGLVAPYLAYMRQDKRFQEGEGVSSIYFAKLVSKSVDWLVTVEPHLHRLDSLEEIYDIPALAMHSAPNISAWIRRNITEPLLIGPDSESEAWVKAVAIEIGAPFIVLKKIRRGDREVEIVLPDISRYKNKTPLLLDDIISTARTMIETIAHLKKSGMKPPVCVGVHGVFAGSAYRELQRAGAAKIVTCNTIPHESNAIDLTGLLVEGIKKVTIRSPASSKGD